MTTHRALTALLVLSPIFFFAHPANAAEPPTKSPALVAKGTASFADNCAVCHGPNGRGDGEAATDPKPPNFQTDKFKNGTKPAQVFATLKTGVTGTDMPSFSNLPDEELWALAYHVLDLRAAKSK